MIKTPETVPELAALVVAEPRVWTRGGGTKPRWSDGATVSTEALTGVVEYQPAEFTITVRAGTRWRDLSSLLAAERQEVPFDPPLIQRGATVGGTIATGLSSSGRFRFGGVRDFVLGARFVDGEGRDISAGGRVVKNAAGFDLPKLLVGSLGTFGIIVETTLKVFPVPESSLTIAIEHGTRSDALSALGQWGASAFDLDALDYEPPHRLLLRVRGASAVCRARRDRIAAAAGAPSTTIHGTDEQRLWAAINEFEWVPSAHALYKVPTTPSRVGAMEAYLSALDVPPPRRYAAGGHLLWLAWPAALEARHWRGLIEMVGGPALPLWGNAAGDDDEVLGPFAERLRSALDPRHRFRRN